MHAWENWRHMDRLRRAQAKSTAEIAKPPDMETVPAALAKYYRKQDEHAERETALPAYIVKRVNIADMFPASDEDDEGDE